MSLQMVVSVIVGLVAGMAIEYADIERLKAQLATAHSELANIRQAAATQAAQAHATDIQNEARAHDLQTQLESTLAAHRFTAAALADRVRDYAAARHACAVRPAAGATTGGHGHDGPEAITGGLGPVDDALAAIVGDAQAVIDQGMACAKWAAGVQP